MNWARRNPHLFPVDVNAAPREMLLRVPGIGYGNVERILRIRRYHQLSAADLKKLHVRWRDAAQFVVATDHLPSKAASLQADVSTTMQMPLFQQAAASALTGVL